MCPKIMANHPVPAELKVVIHRCWTLAMGSAERSTTMIPSQLVIRHTAGAALHHPQRITSCSALVICDRLDWLTLTAGSLVQIVSDLMSSLVQVDSSDISLCFTIDLAWPSSNHQFHKPSSINQASINHHWTISINLPAEDMYRLGQGIKKDYSQAIYWYQHLRAASLWCGALGDVFFSGGSGKSGGVMVSTGELVHSGVRNEWW